MTNRNNSLDMFRLLCAFLVVAIHLHPFIEINADLGYFFSDIISRIAVPFFFMISGYYYIRGLEKGNKVFIPYIKKTLTVYFIWSCIYFVLDFFKWGYLDISSFCIEEFIAFFISGSHYHFWFFPSLIISISIVTFLFKIGCKKLVIPLGIITYIIGCLGTSYYGIGINIPVLESLFKLNYFTILRRIFFMGFPFVAIGYLVFKLHDNDKNNNLSKLVFRLIISIVLWIIELYFVNYRKLQISIVITFMLMIVVISIVRILLYCELPNLNKQGKFCYVCANFIYYSHPLIILFVTTLFPNITDFNTILYLLTIFLGTIIAYFIYKKNNTMLLKLIK